MHAAFGKNSGENAAAGTVHCVHRKLELGFRDQVHAGEGADGCHVILLKINFLDRSSGSLWGSARRHFFFDLLHDGRGSRTAEVGLELHAVPVPGIVAGSDHYAARGPLLLDRV